MKRIGILTSGGDAPGMNACIRAVVRQASQLHIETTGIIHGFQGMVQGVFRPLLPRDMAHIIQRGGTILKTSRCPEFFHKEVRAQAVDLLRAQDIDSLIVIGGDGSLTAAHLLATEHNFPVVGVPASIDHDLPLTDACIGFDTAINTALEAIDRIRDTADSHDRLFIVEVMGHNTGFIAQHVGLAGGAEDILTPDTVFSVDDLIAKLRESRSRGKQTSIIVAAEGKKPGRSYDLAEALRKKSGLEAKVCILGHIQRGGSPSAQDRILASRLGAAAVRTLANNSTDCMVALNHHQLVSVPLSQVLATKKVPEADFLDLARILA